jgi:hypothetical protein
LTAPDTDSRSSRIYGLAAAVKLRAFDRSKDNGFAEWKPGVAKSGKRTLIGPFLSNDRQTHRLSEA